MPNDPDLFFDQHNWSWICALHPPHLCQTCQYWLPECCFYPDRRNTRIAPVRPRCRACEQERRDEAKLKCRYLSKARDGLTRHMRIERKQKLHNARNLEEYLKITGLTIEWVADQMRRNVEEHVGCSTPTCNVTFLGPGEVPEVLPLNALTIDRPDRSRMLGKTNFQIPCNTCNTAKGRQDIHTYEMMTAVWQLRADHKVCHRHPFRAA